MAALKASLGDSGGGSGGGGGGSTLKGRGSDSRQLELDLAAASRRVDELSAQVWVWSVLLFVIIFVSVKGR